MELISVTRSGNFTIPPIGSNPDASGGSVITASSCGMSKITSYSLTAASSSNHLPRGVQVMIINGGARIQVYGIHERQETTTCTYTIVITGIPE